MKKGKAAKEEARIRKTERFSDVLPRFVSSFGQEKEYLTHLFFHHWKEIAGPSVALHVRPVRMDFHKLFLAADAPVWANELRYMERKLIDKINAFVCEELVKEICFCTPQEETFAVRRLLLREPWLHGYEVSHIIGCSRETAFQARFSLLQTIASRIPKGDETSDDAKMLVMLFAAIKPEKLTGPIISKYMERLRFDLLPDIFPSDGKKGKRSILRRNA